MCAFIAYFCASTYHLRGVVLGNSENKAKLSFAELGNINKSTYRWCLSKGDSGHNDHPQS